MDTETTKTTTSQEDEIRIDVVNPETGELVSVLPGTLPKSKLLYHLGRAASNIRKEVAQGKEQLAMNISNGKALFQNFSDRADAKLAMMNELAVNALREEAEAGNMPLDKKNRPYYNIPGHGKWGYRTGQAALIDVGWDGLDEHEKADAVQVAPEGTYKTIMEYKPVKKEIKKAIVAGRVMPGWMIAEAVDKLSFTDEN